MDLSALTQTIIGFVAIVCVGVALRIFKIVDREDARVLNAVIIYVGLPAFIFTAVNGAAVISEEMLRVVGVAWAVFAVIGVLSFLVAKALRLQRRRTGAFLLAASLGNTGYIGYPLTAALLGSAAVPVAVFYDVFGTVLQLVLVGFPAARHYGGQGIRLTPLRLMRELATFPALIAAVAALLVPSALVPIAVGDWLGIIAKMVAPLIMLSVGISLRPRAIAHGAVALLALLVIRLAVAPGLAVMFGGVVLSDPIAFRVTALEAGMPSMMLTLAVGERFGLDDDFIAAAVFVTTAASVVTVPLWQSLVR